MVFQYFIAASALNALIEQIQFDGGLRRVKVGGDGNGSVRRGNEKSLTMRLLLGFPSIAISE